MVLGWLSQIGQVKFGVEGAGLMAQRQPEETASETYDSFLKAPETKKAVDEWSRKGYTKRGVTKLLRMLWLFTRSKKESLKEAKDILSSLKGEDGLGKILGVLKLASEGLRKIS